MHYARLPYEGYEVYIIVFVAASDVAAGDELYIQYGNFWRERDYEVSRDMDPAPCGTLMSDDYLAAMQKVSRNPT